MGIVKLDGSFELLGFLADYFDVRKVQIEAMDDHGLHLKISLDGGKSTSVTKSSGPLKKD